MKVKLELAEGLVRFQLASGNPETYRRMLVPYGRRADARSIVVPTPAAWLACAAVTKAGGQLFAEKNVQASVRSAAWQCSVPKIYPFQKIGAEFLRSRRRAVLADQMGLGKSAQALAAIDERKAALVIAPPVVLGSWYDEARRWRSDLHATLWRRPYNIFPEPGEIRIASYSALPFELVEPRTRCPFCERLSVIEIAAPEEPDEEAAPAEQQAAPEQRWKNRCDRERGGCGRFFDQRDDAFVEHVWVGERPKHPVQLIVDEAHYCKSRKARRTLTVRAIATQAVSTWLLTGTPLLNTPEELWSLCQIFPGPGAFSSGAHDAFGSWRTFVELFHGRKKKYGGYEWSAAGDVSPECGPRLGSLMLRRMREEVLPELPKKTRRFLQVEIDERGLPAWGAEKLAGMTDDEVLAECAPEGSLSTVRKLLAERKLPALLQLVDDFEEQDEPVIVFSYHRGPIEQLAARKGWATITGSTPDTERARFVRDFQDGKFKGIAGTIGAMGVGVTLTRASNVIFLDRDFVPANNLQGEDRAARIGQKRAVLVTILMTMNAVDLRVRDVLERKERLLESMQLSDGDVPTEASFQKKAVSP